jgi:hypothetical protein
MVFNSYEILKDHYPTSYDELGLMPYTELTDLVEKFRPRIEEIYKRRESKNLEKVLEGKSPQ